VHDNATRVRPVSPYTKIVRRRKPNASCLSPVRRTTTHDDNNDNNSFFKYDIPIITCALVVLKSFFFVSKRNVTLRVLIGRCVTRTDKHVVGITYSIYCSTSSNSSSSSSRQTRYYVAQEDDSGLGRRFPGLPHSLSLANALARETRLLHCCPDHVSYFSLFIF